MKKPVPRRQVEGPKRVLKCADGTFYRNVKTNAAGAADAVVVPSAHDLAEPTSSGLDPNMLVTWLGIVAHGKTVRGEAEKAATSFEAASRAVSASLAFTDNVASKHSRIVKEFQRVAKTSGSLWSVAEPRAKNVLQRQFPRLISSDSFY